MSWAGNEFTKWPGRFLQDDDETVYRLDGWPSAIFPGYRELVIPKHETGYGGTNRIQTDDIDDAVDRYNADLLDLEEWIEREEYLDVMRGKGVDV